MDMDMPVNNAPKTLRNITEYPLNWPDDGRHTSSDNCCSTHELVITSKHVFVSGQNMDKVAQFDLHGNLLNYFDMPLKSGPHGLMLDRQERLWVSLEFAGMVVRLDEHGDIVEEIDVMLYPEGTKKPINTAPHGICLGVDGETIWFTGKRTSTIGRINPDKTVEHFQIETLGAVPIFLTAGVDDSIWGTELIGNQILKVSAAGVVQEIKIPTLNCRPIGIIPDPSGECMWFTEETGVKIGKIAYDGKAWTITEYPVPALQKNDVLASLVFDDEGHLWVQVYVDMNNPEPTGYDYILKFDKSIRTLESDDISGVPFSTHTIPSKKVMMHRIRKDAAGNLWFTEMMADRLGKVTLK